MKAVSFDGFFIHLMEAHLLFDNKTSRCKINTGFSMALLDYSCKMELTFAFLEKGNKDIKYMFNPHNILYSKEQPLNAKRIGSVSTLCTLETNRKCLL